MATVYDTIVPMIQSYPSLYPNRKKALMHLFSDYGCHWVNGELVDDDAAQYTRAYGEWAVDISKYEGEGNESLRFMHLFKNAEMKVCVDHAGELAEYTGYAPVLEDITLGWMHQDHFADMPEDVTEDWFEAAKELAFAMIVLGDKIPENDAYRAHKEQAALNARRFLLRHGLLSDDARQNRIAELKAELAQLEGQD